MAHSYRSGLVTWYGGTRFKSRSGRIFVIAVVHIQCSKLFKGMACTVYGTVHYKEPLKSFKLRLGHSPGGFGLPSVAILPHCAENDVKQYSLGQHSDGAGPRAGSTYKQISATIRTELGQHSDRAGSTFRQSWVNIQTELGQHSDRAGSTFRRSWVNIQTELDQELGQHTNRSGPTFRRSWVNIQTELDQHSDGAGSTFKQS